MAPFAHTVVPALSAATPVQTLAAEGARCSDVCVALGKDPGTVWNWYGWSGIGYTQNTSWTPSLRKGQIVNISIEDHMVSVAT